MFLTEKEESLNEILYLLNYLNNLILENVDMIDKKYECCKSQYKNVGKVENKNVGFM